jgi:aminomethyltransferase
LLCPHLESAADRTPLLTTPLNALHIELGARMVPFAGYSMPVQYPAGLMAEHHHTRTAAGLFDVSHMGQLRLVGADAAAAFRNPDARGRDRPARGQAALRPAADRRAAPSSTT